MRALLIVALAGAMWQLQEPPVAGGSSRPTGAGGASGPSIAGRAVRITNNEPILHARIPLTMVDGGLSDAIVLATDDEGRFEAVNMRPGSYRLFAEHEEHVRTESAAVTVGPGKQIQNVIVRMIPTGVITGRVVDEHDDPVARVYVRAATKDLNREAQTNDLGDTTDPAEATRLELQPGMVLSGIDLRAR